MGRAAAEAGGYSWGNGRKGSPPEACATRANDDEQEEQDAFAMANHHMFDQSINQSINQHMFINGKSSHVMIFA